MESCSLSFFTPAQTNTALLVQMRQAGFGRDALGDVQRAYRIACRLFNGRYRKTERTFLCHAVGAASSVARFDDRLPLVLAALLHAAYDSGQFPDGRIGHASRRHRAWLMAQVGTEVESIIFRYARFDFGLGEPERYLKRVCGDGSQDLLLMALAHEIDDMADLGLRFAPKYGRSIGSRVDACTALAHRIGKPDLAWTLRSLGRLYADTDWIADLESKELHGHIIVPNANAYVRHRLSHLLGRYVKVQ